MYKDINISSRKKRTQKPFICITKLKNKFQIDGQYSCVLGRRIKNDNGACDEGIYAEWSWDGERLSIQNDKYGFFPLFYYQKNKEIYVSTSIPALLEFGASAELDYPAVSVFIRMGFFIGEDTPFKHIKALPPNAYLEWKDGQVIVEGQYTHEKPLNITRDAAIDKYIALFRKAVKKRLPQDDDFVVPLSGGRDSRHILLELNKLGYRPKFCITHEQYPCSPYQNEDVRVAKLLTDALDIKHVVLRQSESRFKSELKKNLLVSMCSDEHQQSLVMADYLRGKAGALYDGIAEDTLSEGKLRDPKNIELYEKGQLLDLSKKLFAIWGSDEHVIKSLVNNKFYSKIDFDCAIEHMIRELKKHEDAPDSLASFFFWNRTRREISLVPYIIHADTPVVHSPYLDHDLVQFLLSLPTDLLSDSMFHTETIKRAYSKYACIPFEKLNPDKKAAMEERRNFIGELIWYYLSNLNSQFLNSLYILPRLMYSLINKSYCHSLRWFPLEKVVYLLQLEGMAKH